MTNATGHTTTHGPAGHPLTMADITAGLAALRELAGPPREAVLVPPDWPARVVPAGTVPPFHGLPCYVSAYVDRPTRVPAEAVEGFGRAALAAHLAGPELPRGTDDRQ